MQTKAAVIKRSAPSSLSRYGIAMLSVVLATLSTIGLNRLGCPTTFSLLYAAVVLSAWIGGFFPALTVTVLSAIASVAFFRPLLDLSNIGFANSGRLLLFLVNGLIVSFFGEAYARSQVARRAAEQTELALRESEHRYRHIFENASEGIFQSTPDGTFIAANPALARMHGFDSPEEFIREMHDIPNQVYVDPTRRAEFKRLLNEYGIVRSFEHEVFRKDGTTVWISVNALAVRDNDWNIQFFEGTSRDITKRKAAEDALRRSEEQYRELFENANDAIYVHDLNGNYTSVNRAAERLSGFSRDEIIGKNFVEFVSPKHLKTIRERLSEKLLLRNQTAYEIEIIAKDSQIVPVEVTSRLIYENGVPVGVQGIARDMSDRKRTEALLRNFPRRLIGAQEAERRRIARELHDEIGQALTAIKINLQGVKESAGAEHVGVQLDGSLGIIDRALDQVRELALDLRPSLLDDLGLVAALRWYLDRETARAGLTLDLNIDLYKTRLAQETETTCFRIVQEALTNIVRHARATRVSVELILRGTEIQLVIQDDGVGFDVGAAQHGFASGASLGLQGMQERVLAVGGTMIIESSNAGGTELRAQIPFLPNLSSNDFE